MPIYEFQCKKCGHQFEELMGYYDKRPTKCKHCKGKLIQKFSVSSINVDGSHKTVGSLADANAAKMTEEQRTAALEASRTKKKFDPRLGPKDKHKFPYDPQSNFESIAERDACIRGDRTKFKKNYPK